MPTSTVSRRIAELEEQLRVRLLERSTRSLRLTDVGSEVLEHAQRTAELSEAVDNIVSNVVSNVSGTLRLSAPPSILDSLVVPLVRAFQDSHPNVRVSIFVTERFVDHIAEGIDLAFRRGILADSTFVARRILTYRHQLVASPSYLKKHKPPRTPHDLLGHRLLAFSYWKPGNNWTFAHTNGKDKETLTFDPHLSMNHFVGLAHALQAGAGIGELPPIVRQSSCARAARRGHAEVALRDAQPFNGPSWKPIHPATAAHFQGIRTQMARKLLLTLPN